MPISERCLQVMADAHELSDEERDHVVKTLEGMKDDPDFKAKAQATAEEWQRQASIEARNRRLQMAARYKIEARIDSAQEAMQAGKTSAYKVGQSYYVGTDKKFTGARDSLDTRMRGSAATTLSRYVARVANVAGRSFSKLFQDKGFNVLLAKELAGESTGNDVAKQIADISRGEYAAGVKRLNDAGADIRPMPGYIFAQRHDPYRLTNAGEKQWTADIKPLLDLSKTFSGDDQDKALSTVYKNIITGQHDTPWKDKEYTNAVGLAKTLSRARVLHFKDAESFLKYNEKYGGGTTLNNVVHQLQGMSKNATLMERMGPNVQATHEWMMDRLSSVSRGTDNLLTPGDQMNLKNQLDVLTGASHKVTSQKIAHAAAVFRAAVNLAHLGTSTFSSLGDANGMAMILHYNGMPLFRSYAAAVNNLVKFFTLRGALRDPEKMAQLKSLGSGMDGFIHDHAGRWAPNEDFPGTAARMQGLFFQLNGQSNWDDSFKYGASKMLATFLAENHGNAWKDLNPRLQNSLSMGGITDKDWEALRKSDLSTVEGYRHLLPENVKNKELAEKYQAWLLNNAEAVVPLPGAYEHSLLTSRLVKGDPVSELLRTMFMFKTFPTSLISKMWPRAAEMGLPGIAMATIGGIPFGYASIAIKNALEGKDPPDPEHPATMLAAMMQGGASSFAGDLIMHKFDAQHSLADLLAGPAIGELSDAAMAASAPAHGEKVGPGIVNVLGRNVPFANLWFTKGMWKYLVVDHLQEAMSPGYLQREEDRAAEQYDEHYFLPPSQVSGK